jgi:hypothetical protein
LRLSVRDFERSHRRQVLTAEADIRFFALPNSPHLTYTHCGYTMMTLAGFSEWITSEQVERVTINGVEQEFKPLGTDTIAVIPAFRQEAQTVNVYCKATTSEGSVQNWTHLPSPPPDLTPATHNRYMKEP